MRNAADAALMSERRAGATRSPTQLTAGVLAFLGR